MYRCFEAFEPPEALSVDEWADRYRILSQEASAESGRWYTSRAEYLRGPMRAILDPKVETVVLMTSTQVGKSELILNAVGYLMDREPCGVMVVNPTLEIAESFSKDRVTPMVRDTKVLRDRLLTNKSKNSSNTIKHKVFKGGGHVTMAGANSPSSLASRPLRAVFCDEIDRYPASAGNEGPPVDLSIQRVENYWNKKIILASTPTIKGVSNIEKWFNLSSQNHFYVPCPKCEHFQTLKWSSVMWKGRRPETAKYVCENCEEHLHDGNLNSMLKRGEWRKHCESVVKIEGFFINSIYSPWVKLERLVQKWLDCGEDKEKRKTFINTSLAQTWEESYGETYDSNELYARRENYEKVPYGAYVLVGAVDVQKDRLEGTITAFGEHEESWGIKHFVIYGEHTDPYLWQRLDDVLFDEYSHESGMKMKVSQSVIDSGFFTNEVYKYCHQKRKEKKRVFPIKGLSTNSGKNIISPSSRNNTFKLPLFPVNTFVAKQSVYARLELSQPGPGYMHFPNSYGKSYFEQLTAEVLATRKSRGHDIPYWRKIKQRNEALDLAVYALAAIAIINPVWRKEAERFEQKLKDMGIVQIKEPLNDVIDLKPLKDIIEIKPPPAAKHKSTYIDEIVDLKPPKWMPSKKKEKSLKDVLDFKPPKA